jgi:hypothetical protein
LKKSATTDADVLRSIAFQVNLAEIAKSDSNFDRAIGLLESIVGKSG